jgi:hypothetical protein
LAVLLIVLCAIVYLVVRHYQADRHEPAVISNRAQLLSRATAALRGDPSIGDVVYNAAADQWDVTPASADADPRAFGQYVCYLLGQDGVAAAHTNVRVIDGARLEASGFDYAAASRGVIVCGGRE